MLCQLLSLDKRYHTVNCFNFNRVDSYLNFNNIQNNYITNKNFQHHSIQNQKTNYNVFAENIYSNSNFQLAFKYNLYNKNYSLIYGYYLPIYIKNTFIIYIKNIYTNLARSHISNIYANILTYLNI